MCRVCMCVWGVDSLIQLLLKVQVVRFDFLGCVSHDIQCVGSGIGMCMYSDTKVF